MDADDIHKEHNDQKDHNDMPEIVLTAAARALLRCARADDAFHDLVVCFPPTAGVLNRVADCLGDEIQCARAPIPLVAATWGRATKTLTAAEAAFGFNTSGYLIDALHAALAPLDEALHLEVFAGSARKPWRPEDNPCWLRWRAAHPGHLSVTRERALDNEQRENARVALERWALGPIFTDEIDLTAQWPITATSA